MTVAPPSMPSRDAALRRASADWAELRSRLATVTPTALGRAILVTAVIGGAIAAAAGTWPALLPYFVGGLIAHTALPVVDSLDRLMPRPIAAAVTILAILGAVVGVVVIVVPPLTNAVIELTRVVPSAAEIDRIVAKALGTLPESARAVAAPILIAVAGTAKGGLAGASGGLADVGPTVVNASLGVVGAALGLLVLPAWLLTILTSSRRAAVAVDGRLAGWLRPDLWAIVRMLDRAVGTYMRQFVASAFAVVALTYLGLTLSARLGGPVYPGALALSMVAGAVQLVPELGGILGLIPAALLVLIDPQRAVVYLAVYVGARWLGGTIVGSWRGASRVRVHPLILIPGIVALSQLGVLWLLLSAPILTFASDLIRYVHGRLSEPPRPAGLLPGEPLPAAAIAVAAPVTPAVYRRFGRVPLASKASATGSVSPVP